MPFAKERAAGGFGIGLAVGAAVGFWSGNMGRWIVFGLLMGVLLALVFSMRRPSSTANRR
jgi:hypothetical protein